MATIDLLRRILGTPPPSPEEGLADRAEEAAGAREADRRNDAAGALGAASSADAAPSAEAVPDEAPDAAACPTCGYLVEPPPTRSRRCPSCRRPIVVRQVEGRVVYLTEDAVEVFEAERQRVAVERGWDAARSSWLRLAEALGASVARTARVARSPISEEAVEAARRLYLDAADRAVSGARREHRWADVALIRRAEAAACYAAAGSPLPAPEEILAMHREGMLALLRSLGGQGTGAELVSAGCCPACRADDGKAFKIASELRLARLPHAGCPKGICACDWFIGVVEKRRRRRRPTWAKDPMAGAPGEARGAADSELP